MKGKWMMESLSSLVLRDNPLGDPRRREMPVYLPPSYGTRRGRRYPTIYYLPGFTGTGRGASNYNPWKENVIERFDRLIAAGRAKEAILVVPDAFTAYGGSQYLNSSATGRYEDHVVQEVVAYIEDKFAVVRAPEGRALIGKSSGGFGALTLAMRHPAVFGHAVSHSGDAGFDVCYAGVVELCRAVDAHGGSLQRFVAAFRASRDKAGIDHEAINAVAMAACYSPNPASRVGFDLPFDLRTGERVPAVWRKWEAHDPVVACVARAKDLRRLKTIWFDAGRKDEFRLHLGARRLDRALADLRVPHTYVEHERGHFDLDARLDVSLPLLSRRCRREG